MNDTLRYSVLGFGKKLSRWLTEPRVQVTARMASYACLGFVAAAASLASYFQPLALALCCACTGWASALVAAGGVLGYLTLWGDPGWQGALWLITGLAMVCLITPKRARQTALLLPALAMLIVAAWGVIFQSFFGEQTPVLVYLQRMALSFAACWVLGRVINGREPVCEWIAWGFATLSLAQLVPVLWLNPGYILAAGLCVAGPFPAAVLAGLGLDLAGITALSVTAVMCAGYLIRFWPQASRWLVGIFPVLAAVLVMRFSGHWDAAMLPGLLAGGLIGCLLPLPGRVAYRRGETGVAQVRLEMAAGVLGQAQRLLQDAPETPVDEDALVRRAAEQACAGCPCRHSCKDSRRIAKLAGPILHKSLLTQEEIPVQCRRTGRFLAQLHRSQEQLRTIRADRVRQREYKAAVVQQYRFLSDFLRELADQLPRRPANHRIRYSPWVKAYGNRRAEENGDRCLSFPGVGGRHYVVLCDGMGTGSGAVQEGKTAGAVLQQLLSAGYPASHALRSLNSICALRERAGVVTVDLVELQLDTGKAYLYKWGAPPAWLVTDQSVQRLGEFGPPPGLSVTEYWETVTQFSLGRGELLVLVSDGIGQEQALACCKALRGSDSPGELARALMACGQMEAGDDATVVLIRLDHG